MTPLQAGRGGCRGVERTIGGGQARIVHDYQPFDEVMAGDLIDLNGRLRKVRSVTRTAKDDAVRFIEVLKVQRSRFPSPFTVYTRNDLRRLFRGIAHRGVSLCSTDLERRAQTELARGVSGKGWTEIGFTQEQTVGVIS